MGLDRDAERVLEMVRLSGRPPYETLSAPEARELFLAAREVLAPDPPAVGEIRELSAPGPAGAAVPLRLYRGATTAPGETLPAPTWHAWRDRTGIKIMDGIGSTEMLHIFLSNRPGEIRDGTTGKPVPGYDAKIVGEDGRELGAGEIGELLIRGPSAAEGYWNQRTKSRQTFAGEWTHTGDKYVRDEDGYYHYCGRTDDMFKVSGVWVSPFEVEAALVSHDAVLEAAVIGKEDHDGLV